MTSHATTSQPTSQLRRDDPVPLYSRIRDELRLSITSGHRRAHERLPSEAELMQHYGVSRITVRQAVQDLERLGLVVKVPGKGCYVAPDKPYQELTRLEGFGEAMAQRGHATRNRLLGLQEQRATGRVAERLGLAAGSAVTQIRRVRLLDERPVSVDLTWVPAEIGRRLAREDLQARDIFGILEHDYGIALGHADLAIDAVPADGDLATYLQLDDAAPVLRIERLTHTRAGQPIDYEVLHCRSDNFQYRLRVQRGAQA